MITFHGKPVSAVVLRMTDCRPNFSPTTTSPESATRLTAALTPAADTHVRTTEGVTATAVVFVPSVRQITVIGTSPATIRWPDCPKLPDCSHIQSAAWESALRSVETG